MNISKIWKLIKEKRYEDTKKGLIESPFFVVSVTHKTAQPDFVRGNATHPSRTLIYAPFIALPLPTTGNMRHLPFQGKVKIGLRPFFPNPPKSKYPAASLMLRGSFFYSFSTKSSISKGWFTKCFPPLALRKVSGRKPQVTERQGRWEFLAVSMSTSVSPT